jgi:tRNA (mo5U34)-methyltransferase
MSESLTDDEVLNAIASVPKWYHRVDIRTPGINDSQLSLSLLKLPEDCAGLRVLDIDTRDGFFAFEMERGGAEVLAVDIEEGGFAVASRLLGSRVRFVKDNLYALDPATIGTFDIVLFLGLLYHLPYPLAGLRIVRSLCRKQMYLETLVIDRNLLMADGSVCEMSELDPRLTSIPFMRFYPGDACNHDATNFWGPNIQCVKDMLAATGFSVLRVERLKRRANFECLTA